MRQLATQAGGLANFTHEKGATVPVFVQLGAEAWLASEFQAPRSARSMTTSRNVDFRG